MTVEVATYPKDLNAGLPAHSDGLSEADSHMRLIKATLVTTFPAIAAPITATDADLNAVPALRTSVSTLVSGAAERAQDNTFTARNDFTQMVVSQGGFNGASIQRSGSELLPGGVIALWFGSVASIPPGWVLCDGRNFTPDLRGLFVCGAGGAFAPFQAIGAPGVNTTTSTIAGHSHTGLTGSAGAFTPSVSMDVQGAHSHGGTTAGHTLSVAEMPAHDHGLAGANVVTDTYPSSNVNKSNTNSGSGFSYGGYTSAGGNSPHTHPIATDGAHQHNLTAAAVAAHQHGISTDGGHNHNISFSTVPPAMCLCYIMKQ